MIVRFHNCSLNLPLLSMRTFQMLFIVIVTLVSSSVYSLPPINFTDTVLTNRMIEALNYALVARDGQQLTPFQQLRQQLKQSFYQRQVPEHYQQLPAFQNQLPEHQQLPAFQNQLPEHQQPPAFQNQLPEHQQSFYPQQLPEQQQPLHPQQFPEQQQSSPPFYPQQFPEQQQQQQQASPPFHPQQFPEQQQQQQSSPPFYPQQFPEQQQQQQQSSPPFHPQQFPEQPQPSQPLHPQQPQPSQTFYPQQFPEQQQPSPPFYPQQVPEQQHQQKPSTPIQQQQFPEHQQKPFPEHQQPQPQQPQQLPQPTLPQQHPEQQQQQQQQQQQHLANELPQQPTGSDIRGYYYPYPYQNLNWYNFPYLWHSAAGGNQLESTAPAVGAQLTGVGTTSGCPADHCPSGAVCSKLAGQWQCGCGVNGCAGIANPCGSYGRYYFPYYPDATRFIQCDQTGVFWIRRCAPGTIFDPKISTCNYPPVVVETGKK